MSNCRVVAQRVPYRIRVTGLGPSPFPHRVWKTPPSSPLSCLDQVRAAEAVLHGKGARCSYHGDEVDEPIWGARVYRQHDQDRRAMGCPACAREALLTSYCSQQLSDEVLIAARRSCHVEDRLWLSTPLSNNREVLLACWGHLNRELDLLAQSGREPVPPGGALLGWIYSAKGVFTGKIRAILRRACQPVTY